MKTVTETIKVGYRKVVGPDTDINRWAIQQAAISTSLFILAIVVSIALTTLMLVYIPDEHRWTTVGLVSLLMLMIGYLTVSRNRLEIELKALNTLHEDVLGALSPDTAKALLHKWAEELRDSKAEVKEWESGALQRGWREKRKDKVKPGDYLKKEGGKK